MGRKRPSELRQTQPRRRRHGVRLPDAVHSAQRTPSWMLADEGAQHAVDTRRYLTEYRRARGPATCPETGKRRFGSQLDAARALGSAASMSRIAPHRREFRSYPCDKCDGWHLTSQEKLARPLVTDGIRHTA